MSEKEFLAESVYTVMLDDGRRLFIEVREDASALHIILQKNGDQEDVCDLLLTKPAVASLSASLLRIPEQIKKITLGPRVSYMRRISFGDSGAIEVKPFPEEKGSILIVSPKAIRNVGTVDIVLQVLQAEMLREALDLAAEELE